MKDVIKQITHVVSLAAEDKKAHDLLVLDIQGLSAVADYFVICHGNSTTQVQAIVTEIKKKVEENGFKVKGIEGMNEARWVLIDIGDVVVHVFQRDEREYYHLERLWGDAKIIEGMRHS